MYNEVGSRITFLRALTTLKLYSRNTSLRKPIIDRHRQFERGLTSTPQSSPDPTVLGYHCNHRPRELFLISGLVLFLLAVPYSLFVSCLVFVRFTPQKLDYSFLTNRLVTIH